MKQSVFYLIFILFLAVSSCTSIKTETIIISQNAQTPSDMSDNNVNPLYSASDLPFEAPDFNAIRDEHFMPAFEEGMRQEQHEVDSIASNPEDPTFENTIVALEETGELLTRVRRVFYNLTSAHTNDTIQEIQSELAPKLAAHSDDIYLNPDLFERVRAVYENLENLDLDQESKQLVKETHRNFVRAGAQLNDDEQERIREINEMISSLTTQFQENLLSITHERAVFVDDREKLDGLSYDRIAAAGEAARDRGFEDLYLLSITNTTRQPVLANLNNRDVRRQVWEASAYRGIGEDGGIDNRPLILDLVRLRLEKARLLGYPNWASFVLEPNAAENPENALDMMTDLIPAVTANTKQEADQILEMMEQDGIEDDLQPWDWAYYAEKIREEKYDINDDDIRPYFELNSVLEDGVFYTMQRLFGIRFEERNDLPVYHPDVRVFNVYDKDDQTIGLFYADFFARDSKRGGAWMNSFVSQSKLLEKKPVIVNVLNIPEPASREPALISFDQVTTLFHEMGHAVHGLFSDVTYPSLAGTSVPRDFVEFPSTFQEDWAIHPEVIENYATHYETGEKIPQELLDRVIAAREFNQGFDTQEYLAAALLDMEWHTLEQGQIPDSVEEFEQTALAKHDLDYKPVPPRYKSPYFSHIFTVGYSANYYSYIWSEIMAADAFAYMQEHSGLTRENGDLFRNSILSKGGSKEPMELYLDFTGEEPDVKHLLERRGLDASVE